MNILHNILNPPEPLQSVLGVVNIKPFVDTRNRNIEISKIYTCIVTDIRYLLSRMNDAEHRTYLLTSYDRPNNYDDNVLFEFTCCLCELRLSLKHYCYYLELETDSEIQRVVGGYNYRRMLRIAYRNTSYEVTEHDLEDSISIHTNMVDHYAYFKNRLANVSETNAIILEEDAILE
jgi:hypothetical protein